jgi:hypothetical protein
MRSKMSGSASQKFLTDRTLSRYVLLAFDCVTIPVLRQEVQERHRIDVDCRRTDRTQPLFANNQSSDIPLDPEKQQHQLYSTISPTPDEAEAQSPSNEHIDRLASILLTYNFYEKELGMSFLSFLGTVSVLTACRRVCAGHVRSLRTLVCCRWLG